MIYLKVKKIKRNTIKNSSEELGFKVNHKINLKPNSNFEIYNIF